MTLIVLPATITDIAAVYAVYFDAFADQPILPILFPSGTSAPEFRSAHASATATWWANPAAAMQHTFKCVDTSTGEIVGMAIWDVWWRGRTAEERKKIEIPWLQGKERERAEEFLSGFWERRERNVGGKKHVYLHTMAVHPDHQRRGIGKLLMQWGMDVAERMNVPVYLEATYEGRPLYEKCGFEALPEGVPLKKELTGLKEDVVAPLMAKLPKGGVSFEEWSKGEE